MTRRGKIARLPLYVRNQLNTRLQNGEAAATALAWLNGLPETRELLAEAFDGEPVSEQNVSRWKLGGYADWERHQDSLSLGQRLREEAGEMAEVTDGVPLSEGLTTMLLAEVARTAKTLLEEITDPKERWQRLGEMLDKLARVRREECRSDRQMMDHEDWERKNVEREKQEMDAEIQKAKDDVTAPLRAQMEAIPVAAAFGGGEKGMATANWLMALKYNLPRGAGAPEAPSGNGQAPKKSEVRSPKSEAPIADGQAPNGKCETAKSEKCEHRTSNIERPTLNGEMEVTGGGPSGEGRVPNANSQAPNGKCESARSTPHPIPVASQARHQSGAHHCSAASRPVVPDRGGEGVGKAEIRSLKSETGEKPIADGQSPTADGESPEKSGGEGSKSRDEHA